MEDTARSVRVGRDMHGPLVVGDYNVVTGERSIVTVVQQGHRPAPRRRDAIGLAPRRAAPPLGRDAELAVLVAAAAEGRALQVFGPPGAGKTALLRHTARVL